MFAIFVVSVVINSVCVRDCPSGQMSLHNGTGGSAQRTRDTHNTQRFMDLAGLGPAGFDCDSVLGLFLFCSLVLRSSMASDGLWPPGRLTTTLWYRSKQQAHDEVGPSSSGNEVGKNRPSMRPTTKTRLNGNSSSAATEGRE